MNFLITFAIIAVVLRLITLLISMRNERRLKTEGALEFGAVNSRWMAAAHTAFYVAAICECLSLEHAAPSSSSVAGLLGLVLYICGMVSLILVLRALGGQWTVKLIISPGHRWVKTGIYRYARHPNYLWNILPELIGFALVMHAWWTLLVGLPLYAIPLWIRVRGENDSMKRKFENYMA